MLKELSNKVTDVYSQRRRDPRFKRFVGAILCGGYGKRLRPLTESTPKSLIEIKNGYTILERQMFQLKYVGIGKVYLLAGYLHEKIKERYGENYNGLKIEYLIEDKPRGTLYAINNLLDVLDEDQVAVIMNGDVVTDANISEMLNQWVEDTVSMLVTPLISPYGIVELEADHRITSFVEKPKLPYYINGGIYIVPKTLERHFKEFKEGDVERLVFPRLAREGLLRYYKEDEAYWCSVDSLKDLGNVQKEYENRTDKPWGYEKVIVCTEHYLTKMLYIMKGYRTSLHMHKEKDETLHVIRGEGIVVLEGEHIRVESGDIVRIRPKTQHLIYATENMTIYEYSTPNLSDVVRIEDPYHRDD